MKGDRTRCVLLSIAVALVALAAGGVLALASPGRAAAQQEPTLVLTPPSGPCDALVEVKGSGFEPQKGPAGRLLS